MLSEISIMWIEGRVRRRQRDNCKGLRLRLTEKGTQIVLPLPPRPKWDDAFRTVTLGQFRQYQAVNHPLYFEQLAGIAFGNVAVQGYIYMIILNYRRCWLEANRHGWLICLREKHVFQKPLHRANPARRWYSHWTSTTTPFSLMPVPTWLESSQE